MVKNNILANLSGNDFQYSDSIICIPVYFHYSGVEEYGLIGIFVSLRVIFYVLDVSLNTILKTERFERL